MGQRDEFQLIAFDAHSGGPHRLYKENQRHYDDGRVQHMSVFVTLPEEFAFLIPSLLHDFLVQRIASLQPLPSIGARKRSFIRKTKACSKLIEKP